MNKKQPNKDRKKLDPETWVDRHGDYLYRFALARVRDPSVAEDLVQETFLGALGSRKHFKQLSSEKTWLTGILKHKIIDHFRKTAKMDTYQNADALTSDIDDFFDDDGQWKMTPAKWTADPQKLYEQREFLNVLSDCLSGLSERLANIFILREMMGKSTDDICKLLSITATNSWVMLHRARLYLRRCLEVEWFVHKTPEGS